MRKLAASLLCLVLLASASERSGVEVAAGASINLPKLLKGWLALGPRASVGWFDDWFYLDTDAAYYYGSQSDSWNFKVSLRTGVRFSYSTHPLYLYLLTGGEYYSGAWDAPSSGNDDPAHGVWSINLWPGISAKLTDWLELSGEMTIAWPLGQDGLDPDVKAYIWLYWYWDGGVSHDY